MHCVAPDSVLLCNHPVRVCKLVVRIHASMLGYHASWVFERVPWQVVGMEFANLDPCPQLGWHVPHAFRHGSVLSMSLFQAVLSDPIQAHSSHGHTVQRLVAGDAQAAGALGREGDLGRGARRPLVELAGTAVCAPMREHRTGVQLASLWWWCWCVSVTV